MACRIVNLHSQPLHIDLRGGDRLLLAQGERSPVLREEQLYDNHHLGDWERAGWVRRIPARMRELRAEQEAQARPQDAAGEPTADRPAKKKFVGGASRPAGKKKHVSR